MNAAQRFALTAAAGLWLVLSAPVAQAAGRYLVTDLGDLPGGMDDSRGAAINDAGDVAGTSWSAAGFRPFLWTSSTGIQELAVLPGATETHAQGINNARGVVGFSLVGSLRRAFLWTSSGGVQDLGDLPGGILESEARAINNAGQVVGYSSAAAGARAFVWTSAGGMQDLGDLPGGFDFSEAQAINDAGQVVGSSRIGTPPVLTTASGFYWTSAGGMQDVGDPPGALRSPLWISTTQGKCWCRLAARPGAGRFFGPRVVVLRISIACLIRQPAATEFSKRWRSTTPVRLWAAVTIPPASRTRCC
jgi:probable HAF family extracellular repeat protein